MSEFFQENFDEKEGRGKLNENWKLFANRLFVPKIEKDRGGRGDRCGVCKLLTLTGHVIERCTEGDGRRRCVERYSSEYMIDWTKIR